MFRQNHENKNYVLFDSFCIFTTYKSSVDVVKIKGWVREFLNLMVSLFKSCLFFCTIFVLGSFYEKNGRPGGGH